MRMVVEQPEQFNQPKGFDMKRKGVNTRAATTMLGHAPRVHIKVDQETIDEAVERNSNSCMVSNAIKKAYPNLKYVGGDIQTFRASDPAKGERYIWLTPKSIQQMIVDFDAGKRPRPFSFYFRDGQVIEAKSSTKGVKRPRKATKARLRTARGGNRRTVPERVGGKAPPKAIGSRRMFGSRGLVA